MSHPTKMFLLSAKKQLRHAFKEFDTDKSGFIEKPELSVLIKRLTSTFNVEDPSEQEIQGIMNELDVNGDGKISQKQYERLIKEVIAIMEQTDGDHQ